MGFWFRCRSGEGEVDLGLRARRGLSNGCSTLGEFRDDDRESLGNCSGCCLGTRRRDGVCISNASRWGCDGSLAISSQRMCFRIRAVV